ncbi:peptidylprolyl isomerase [Sphingomonas sp.]|uniref:peptidylprolyl isomerase n=1 Tax=Sphingomonas sp. TaxID=28214 RepID=UPI0035BC7B74
MIVLALTLAAAAQAAPLPSDPIAADWRAIPDDEIMIVTLRGGRAVVVRLAARFAPEHVANIRTLARAHWWDEASVYRVQDNWVAQWGDVTERKPLPAGVTEHPAAEYQGTPFAVAQRLRKADAYSAASGITADGWPMASDGATGWLTHCYASVGVARDATTTGSGAELYTVIGTPARRLDRNYTVVGRIVEGMAYMSAMPRSAAKMGFYAEAAERTPIVSVRLAADLPAALRPHFEYRSPDTPRFAALIARAERPDPPTVASGGVDVCAVPLEVRRAR